MIDVSVCRLVLGARLATPATLPWRRSRGLLALPGTWIPCVSRPTRVRERRWQSLLRWSIRASGDFAGRWGVGLASFLLPVALYSIGEDRFSHQRRGDPGTANRLWVIKGPAIVHPPHPSAQLSSASCILSPLVRVEDWLEERT